MVSFRIDGARPDAGQLASAAAIIRAGGVLAYPTDTLYGLAADPANRTAIARLYRIKGRQVDQAVPLIAAGITQVEEVAGPLAPLPRRLADRFWPGPLTILLPAWAGVDGLVSAGSGRIAIRVPAHPIAQALAAACGSPITSTSANRSGGPASSLPEDVCRALGFDLDAIIDGGPSPGGEPSTIVDVRGHDIVLVRAGAVPWKHVLECLP
jgi:L-threonylcarbamoyladenylate synthase